MEGSSDNHSDSDSGESWTLLEASPSYAATPSPTPSPAVSILGSTGDVIDGSERDEDTDGISIISDSESESIATCEQGARDENSTPEQADETPQLLTENVSVTPEPITMRDPDELTRYDDFLGDSTTLKTYVHRRNTKVSSALNVILLGSVITAAGIALGHIWGVRDDCPVQTNPSVNKILSNLYKLQEENAFLRSKLKELTLAGQIQLQKKATAKINKCRKVFEEPLHNTNVVKTSKCMDLETDIPQEKIEFKKTELPLLAVATEDFESAVDEVEFRNDVKKLNQIYKENRNWLDAEVAKRLKYEEALVKLPNPKKLKSAKDHSKGIRDESIDINNNLIDKKDNTVVPMEIDDANIVSPIIVSYSDSVKYGGIDKNSIDDDMHKRERREFKPNYPGKFVHTKKHIKRDELSDNDDIVAKDNRHSPKMYKFERTKNDRQKQFKKQKRENKYEQWQMKGGYLKDYDSISSFDSHDNMKLNYDNNHHSQKWEKENYVDKFSDIESKKDKQKSLKGEPNAEFLQSKITIGTSSDSKKMKGNKSTEESIPANWFEKRSVLRKQAREMLESEVPMNDRKFLKSNSRWYFRRMSDREQLRSRASNSSEYKTLRRQFKNRR